MHIHSTCSDGTFTPREIARAAHGRGISILALTDHDTLDGVGDFMRACNEYGVRGISGIELSARAPVTVHILGYRFKQGEILQEALDWIVAKRNERNAKICARLRENGVDIELGEVEREAAGRVVARPHFASLLIRKGYAADSASAFSKYLAKGASAYVAREAYSPEDCIKLVRSAGGLPALAHPSQTGYAGEELDELLSELKSYGLWGLECISSHCSSEAALGYLRTADRHGLFPTAGSDFHGSRRPHISLGVQVREDFLPWARLGVNL